MVEQWLPTHLVLGPGGVKSFSILGAMLKLDEIKLLREVKTFIGVSAGSIIQALYVAGYTVREIISEVAGANLFQDIAHIDISKIKSNNGLIPNNAVKDKLNQLFEAKFGFVPTFEELYRLTGLKLVTVTMNLDSQEGVEYMSYETEPGLSVVRAIMLSMNIPFFFYQLNYRDCTYVDGAMGNPYPVDEYDTGDNRILGVYIETKNHVKTNSSISLYWARTIQATMKQMKWRILKNSSSRCKHLELSCKTMDTLGLTTSAEDKANMIFSGIRDATNFIKKLDKPEDDLFLSSSDEERDHVARREDEPEKKPKERRSKKSIGDFSGTFLSTKSRIRSKDQVEELPHQIMRLYTKTR